MANKAMDRDWTRGRDTVRIEGSFKPNGALQPVAASNSGVGFSVAWVSTGLFLVTLDDVYAAIDRVLATLTLTVGDDKYAQGGVRIVSATVASFQIRIWDVSAGAVADVAADAGNIIDFSCRCAFGGSEK